MALIKILFLSDTHLGFDMPARPRVKKRRRGPDFFDNYHRALIPALRDEVDCVVHGGDVLFRSKVPAALVERAFRPLRKIAAAGIPVFVVPGNHERSAIPHGLLASDPGIHIFDRARSYLMMVKDCKLMFAGFPYFQHNVRRHFGRLLQVTDWQARAADINLLCVHHCFEGATVGPSDYTFRYNNDVIAVRDVPARFAAVLSGHIHRHQILTTDLKGNKINVPVVYSGSTERTSFAEKNEQKGYIILTLETARSAPRPLKKLEFHPLPSRPMISIKLDVTGMTPVEIDQTLQSRLRSVDIDAILKLEVTGEVAEAQTTVLRINYLRSILPETVTVDLKFKNSATFYRMSRSAGGDAQHGIQP